VQEYFFPPWASPEFHYWEATKLQRFSFSEKKTKQVHVLFITTPAEIDTKDQSARSTTSHSLHNETEFAKSPYYWKERRLSKKAKLN
jgi:hypothetical protein